VTLFVGQVGDLRRQRASQVAGFAAVTIGAVALIGWWAGLPLLSSWGSGLPSLRPVGALALAALGLALMHPGKDSRVAFALGLAVTGLAALGVILALFNVELAPAIDRWLAPWAAVPAPGPALIQVAVAGALAAGLAGGSLALSRFERHRLAATILASVAGAIASFALLGYVAGIDTLYRSVSVNSPPLPTAVGVLSIPVGIIFRVGTMPTLRKSLPLWHLLVMLGTAIVAPLLLFDAYAGLSIADAQFDEVREELMSEARTLSAGVDREIIGEIERLQALAASPSLRQGDFAEFQRQAEASLAMRQSGNIMLIDRNMQQLVDTWVPFGTHLEKTAVPEPVERAFATGKPQVTSLFMRPATRQFLFAIIVPVQIDGESRYALARAPGQHALAGVAAANELPRGWHAVVSDAPHVPEGPKGEGGQAAMVNHPCWSTDNQSRSPSVCNCNGALQLDGNCRVVFPYNGGRHDTRDHLEKATFTLHRCPRAAAGNSRSLRPCHCGRWGRHGAAARSRSISCGRAVCYLLSRSCNHNADQRVRCGLSLRCAQHRCGRFLCAGATLFIFFLC
jgi:hypothetical protein